MESWVQHLTAPIHQQQQQQQCVGLHGGGESECGDAAE